MTVKDIFGKDVSEVREEQIHWYLDNCLGNTDVIDACALPKLPEEWESILWEKYTRDDVIKKYEDDYHEAMDVYFATEENSDDDFFVYDCLKRAFIGGWKTAMVLQWIEEGYFNETKKKELKTMYFNIAMKK